MKTVLALHHHEPVHFHLSETLRRGLIVTLSVVLPYAVAAIGVFIYHGQ